MIREFAPAKINLYLHITGRRKDGYHDLDSLVAFAGVGDEIRLEVAPRFDFQIEGPRATALQNEPADNNLVVKVARALAATTGKELELRITLVKNLPVASGIGGGSSDAAAALRALAMHWGISTDDPRLLEAAKQGGQDVLVCLKPDNCYITADGTAPARDLPHTDIVLVNPNKALSTADVYKAYKESGAAFSQRAQFGETIKDTVSLIDALKIRHNDLGPPAVKLLPVIGNVLKALEKSPSCLFSRMSGSGATCFGLFPDRDSARRAAAEILASNPDWWVIQSHIPLIRDRRQNF